MGGDEFTILVQQTKSNTETQNVAEKIISVFEKPFSIFGNEIQVSPSIGIAVYPHHGKTADTLLKHADIAMYNAKKMGRNTFQFFTQKMDSENSYRIKMESKLRSAIKDNQLVMHYQPKFCLQKDRLFGMEALVRWPTTDGKFIMPNEFISIAEESGLIIPLGKYILEKVCRETKGFFDNNLLDGRVSVNVSTLQFNQRNFIHELTDILDKTQFNPENLELEITESAIIHDFDRSTQLIDQLHSYGITVAMDDFGMGFSSLSYLQKLPVDILKIDKSFIDDITSSEQALKMVEFIIQLAHHLELNVVAEGIEHAEQAKVLTQINCDKAQGFYFAKPQPLNDVLALLDPVQQNTSIAKNGL